MFQPAHIQHSSCICMTWIIMYILIQEVCGLIKPRLDSLKAGSFSTQQKRKDAEFYCLLQERKKGKRKQSKKKLKKNREKWKEQAREKNIDHMNAGNVSCYHKPEPIKIWYSLEYIPSYEWWMLVCFKEPKPQWEGWGKFCPTTISSWPFPSSCMLIGQISYARNMELGNVSFSTSVFLTFIGT